ncbi:MAG: hypothetical protein WD186_06185, partial [Actinomycetota bacterium]
SFADPRCLLERVRESQHAEVVATPEEPPQVFVRSYGFKVRPKIGLNVYEPELRCSSCRSRWHRRLVRA